MPNSKQSASSEFERLMAVTADRLTRNKVLRRRLPGGGRIHIDRQLPFLYVCRTPGPHGDHDTPRLITTEASYLIAPSGREYLANVQLLCRRIVATLREVFDRILLVEIWSTNAPRRMELPEWEEPEPRFFLVTSPSAPLSDVVRALQTSLSDVHAADRRGEVSTEVRCQVAPPDLPPLLSPDEAEQRNVGVLGIEVDPIYRDPRTGALFPLLLRELRPQFSRALKRAACAFAGLDHTRPPRHFESLGRRALVRAVGASDRLLAEVAKAFDFLLLVTPINAEQAWREFAARRFEQPPRFFYRPLPIDPDLLKRKLFHVPLERIEDPTLAHLLRNKQHELDGQITMLRERGTRRFMLSGLLVYGEVQESLLDLANRILAALPPGTSRRVTESDAAGAVDAKAFAARAQLEIDAYRRLDPKFRAQVEITDEIPSGLMVARHRLLVSANFRTTANRVEPLIHHEVGTHLVTAHNGRVQPFRQLESGLAGYEPLQEGLAVLAEYLVGGLTGPRMRVLAARVIAGHAMTQGATFIETFRLLTKEHGFSDRSAFTIAMRVFRGGGIIKDVLYLKGFDQLLTYLRRHREMEHLYVGKIALDDVPYMQELRRREIVQPPAIEPRFLKFPAVRQRLEACHDLDTVDLLRECAL